MKQITKTINLYTFAEADKDLRDKIRDYFATSGGHGDHILRERIETLKALAKVINGDLDYSLSLVPDRHEFIRFDGAVDFDALDALVERDEACPLTGVCYDDDLLESYKLYRSRETRDSALNLALSKYIDLIHAEYEYSLTDEYLADLCEANDYWFTENGKLQ